MSNPNELTIENSALVLIDHQPYIALAVQSIDNGIKRIEKEINTDGISFCKGRVSVMKEEMS